MRTVLKWHINAQRWINRISINGALLYKEQLNMKIKDALDRLNMEEIAKNIKIYTSWDSGFWAMKPPPWQWKIKYGDLFSLWNFLLELST